MILTALCSAGAWAVAMLIGVLVDLESAATHQDGLRHAIPWGTLLLPPLASWVVLDLIHTFTPRRLFDRRSTAQGSRVVIGGLAGALSLGIAVIVLPFAQDAVPDWIVVTGASFVGMVVLAVNLARCRQGVCAICGYDLRNLPRLDRCPKCGNTDMLSISMCCACGEAAHRVGRSGRECPPREGRLARRRRGVLERRACRAPGLT